MKKALRKDFFMEIRRSYTRFLSIFFIVALGVAFFSGIQAASPDMRYSGDAYFDEHKLMDGKVISTMGLTEDDVKAIEQLPAVHKAEGGYGTDILSGQDDRQSVLHVESLPRNMNFITVTEGRLPETKGECLVDLDYMEQWEYKTGDTLTFKEEGDGILSTTEYKIVGVGTSSLYVSFARGNTTLGSGEVGGFAYVTDDSFDSEVYTQIYMTAVDALSLNCYGDAYGQLIDRLTEQLEGIEEVQCQLRYDEVTGEAQEEIDKAQKELDDGKAEAQKELDDARQELDEGAQEIADGWVEYNDGIQQLEDAKVELEDGKVQLENGYTQYSDGISQLNAAIEELNRRQEDLNNSQTQVDDGKAQLESSQMTPEQSAMMTPEQLAQAQQTLQQQQAQLDEAQAQINSGQVQINQGWAEIEAQHANLDQAFIQLQESQQQLQDAEEEIMDNEQKLEDARKELEDSEKELADGEIEYKEAKAEADKEIARNQKKLDDAKADLEDLKEPEWIISDRSSLPEYDGYGDNASRIHNIGRVFPVLFFLVAALINLTTMTRMVEEQRTQIGTLKALGYGQSAIAGKFILYALFATIGGSILGILIGEKIIPYIIITAYGIIYTHMPNMVIPYEGIYSTMASLVAIFCTMLATVAACYRAFIETPASLMRPPSPKAGKRVFLERIDFIWKHFSFSWKSTIRNLIRYKKRLFMTVFGIGGCMALLLVGFGLRDSIMDIGVLQYDQIQLYDGIVVTDEDAADSELITLEKNMDNIQGVEKYTRLYFQQMDAQFGKKLREVYLYVPEEQGGLEGFIVFRDRLTHKAYTLGDEGVIISEKTASLLEAKVGDTITLQSGNSKGRRVKIADICENYMQHYVYMSPKLYEENFGRSPEYQDIIFTVAEEYKNQPEEMGKKILENDAALSITYTASIKEQLDDMLGSLDMVILVLIVSAGMLAFVVLYNLNNINITERKRELATLKVLGFYDGDVSAYVFRENVILTFFGILAGIAIGIPLHRFVITTVEVDISMFGRNINPPSFLYSILFTIGFSMFVNVFMHFKLKKIDMVESLKSVE